MTAGDLHTSAVFALATGEPEVIRFHVKKTPRGWRVADIRYEGDQEGLAKALADP